MTERTDHVGWAREFIRAAENAFDGEVTITPREEPTVRENIALAQVHATLALVEQQRIANLLSIAHWVSDEHLGRKLDDLRMGVAGEVWEGLGL